MKIIHCIAKVTDDHDVDIIYRNSEDNFKVPREFYNLLCDKVEKWGECLPIAYQCNRNEKGKVIDKTPLYQYLSFTYGEDEDYMAIAITDPRDTFSRKIGHKIVVGRLNHASKGLYSILPNTVIRR